DRITIDGLWDHVRPATDADVALLERLPFDEGEVKRIHGIDSFVRGLTGTPLKLKHFFEPTCTICGLVSGYSGPGSKTVLPAVASAKLDFRLVPDLEPVLVGRLLRAHLDKRGFSDIEMVPFHGERPSRWPADSDAARAAVVVAPVITQIASDFDISTGTAGLLVAAYGAPGIIVSLIVGPFSDRGGRKRFLVAGSLLMGLFTLISAFATSFLVLIALRTV